MKGTWEITPGGIAALVYVRTPETTGNSQCAVYLSKARGIVVGLHDTPLSESGFNAEKRALRYTAQHEIVEAKRVQAQTGCTWTEALRIARNQPKGN